MFSAYLTDFNLILLGLAVAYGAGVLTAQKVKDLASGLPSRARVALKASENDVRAKLKAAEDDVLAKLPGVVPAKAPAPAGLPLNLAPAVAAVPLKDPIVVTVEKIPVPPAAVVTDPAPATT